MGRLSTGRDFRPGGPRGESVYSIGAVSRMLGVPTSTLRGWEARYGALAPKRSSGSQRLYSQHEVDQLRFIKSRLDGGARAADAHRLLHQEGASSAFSPLAGTSGARLDGTSSGEVLLGGAPVPTHAHYPVFYNSDEGRLRLAIPFLADGLRLGQPCFLSVFGELREAYLAALRKVEGLDVDRAIRDGRLTLVDVIGVDVEDAVAFWERSFWRVLASGPTIIRIVGDMDSERHAFASQSEMLRYEVAYSAIAKRYPAVALCNYDVRVFESETIFQAIKAHPDMDGCRVGTFLS